MFSPLLRSPPGLPRSSCSGGLTHSHTHTHKVLLVHFFFETILITAMAVGFVVVVLYFPGLAPSGNHNNGTDFNCGMVPCESGTAGRVANRSSVATA